MNIVETLDRAVGPDEMDGIARTLDLDADVARRAVATALPALLAVLSGKGSTVRGAGVIFDAVRGGAAGHDLASLLGEDETGPLLWAIGRVGDIGVEQTAGLVDLLGPVVLGVLGGEIERRHLSKTELSRFLRDQQEDIADALPDGFARHMSGSRHFDSFRTRFASGTVAPTTDTAFADPALLARADYAETMRRPTAMRAGIAVVLVLLAAAWFLYAT